MQKEISEHEQKLGQQILDSVNNFGSKEGVARYIANGHPTLQQTFMRLAINFMKAMSEKNYTDLRNQASSDLAKKIFESVPYSEIYLPFV